MPLTVVSIALAISSALGTGAPSVSAAPIQTVPTQTVEQYVESYFANQNEPIMATIAGCESQYRQFDTDGNVYRGEENHQDVGVMQVNEHYHLKESEGLGYNIYSLEGNVAFAQYLYEKDGTAPWDSSSACWDRTKEPSDGQALALAVK